MPKMRTNRSAAKRFRVTGSGGLKRRKTNRRHILTAKTRKRKRQARRSTLVSPSDTKRIRQVLGMS